LLLNWNGWSDTIECLESLFRSSYLDYRVVVCDNDSSDDSVQNIKNWADGHLCPYVQNDNPLYCLSTPPVPKPLDYLVLESGADSINRIADDGTCKLIIIKTGANLGFAGGNNIGLRYILSQDDFELVWILNNDTVSEPDALTHLVDQMGKEPYAGFCGSLLLNYFSPSTVQSVGGSTFNRWTASPRDIHNSYLAVSVTDCNADKLKLDYVSGASTLVRKSLLLDVGLMSEDYFLYFEEIDWYQRARHKYTNTVSIRSIVYHKEGASIGSSSNANERSLNADYYIVRNKIKFTKRFYPFILPIVLSSLLLVVINRIRRSQFNRVFLVLRAALDGLSNHKPD
jgi:GT2 family glycosyltransferase